MQIIECFGSELEKAQPNTSEDFFNRSVVTFIEDGEEKTFNLLYIRYFDEVFSEFTPFTEDPIFTVNGREVMFKDMVALVCLLKNPGFRNRKRVYINTQKEFSHYFQDIDFDKVKEVFQQLTTQGSYQLESPLLFIQQP
ncbi:hypothetical protein JOC85_001940 [Bacillus mesophilus]|uniref:Uncharacterized protein n=1 Tax=Bacillus mesophilus TaxID=1808955 RepID=A0A6M0Q4J6_9BACI|nr:hypothetical protein [Bacillus mesophilus]MBM7661168.1 hypothetical protein [Bacillus mesophilus]NEY71305.1 hypothetical protein [Bacillus mesophilus]